MLGVQTKKILIKGSGDVTHDQRFLDFVHKRTEEGSVVVICGGGSKISAALKKAGYPIVYDDQNRRITKTQEERIIMRDVLEQEKNMLQKVFTGSDVTVVSPVLYAGSILCPINGDDLVKAYELGFDEIYVLTINERIEKKKAIFKKRSKITIVGL